MAEIAFAVSACAVGFACGAWLSLRAGAVAVAALAVAMGVAGASIVPLLLIVLAPWTSGRLIRARGQLVAALGERNRQLEVEQAALAELAVRHERVRIARELHDIVAHHLAVMVIHAGAGRLDAPHEAARFASIGGSGREALDELDRVVEHLQVDAGSPRDINALIRQARVAGLHVEFTPLPSSVDLTPAVQDGVYRVVQEGLTNAIKHAPGSDVLVRVGVQAHDIEIELRDGGSTAPSSLARSGAGMGLAGMRERVEALGGILHTGPQEDRGWRVHALLPLAQSAERTTSRG